MKQLIIALTLLLNTSFFAVQAQNKIPVNDDGQAEYSEVVSQPASIVNPMVSSNELYARALKWVNEFYKNPSTAIQSTVEGESIDLKARMRLTETDKKGNVTPSGYMNYTLTIEFKDGKYRYVISKIHQSASSYFDVTRWENTESDTYDSKRYPSYVEQTVQYFDELVESLKKRMTEPSEEKKSDW